MVCVGPGHCCHGTYECVQYKNKGTIIGVCMCSMLVLCWFYTLNQDSNFHGF